MSMHLTRRNLLRGGLGVAAAGLVLPATARGAWAAPAPGPTDAEIYGAPTTSPLMWQRADPFVTPRTDGLYYFTASVPEYDRLIVRASPTIEGLGSAAETVVWRRPTSGKMGGHIWAPELHRIDGRWYIYFAAGDSDNVFRIRMYVIESIAADPRDVSGWSSPRQIVTPWDSFALDSTTFEHDGQRYLVWAQSEPEINANSSLYIARMTSPFSITGTPARIATPTKSWEVQGFRVNEGPAVIKRNGRIFMTFSASATDARYCMGLLTADDRANLLDPATWSKSADPIFTTNEQTKQYGPGHNSFTVAEDGETDVMVYHARDYRDIVGDPLYDPNRHARAQRLYWHEDGTPLFGVPVGKGGPILRLSPADASSTFVRHFAYVLRVNPAGRELADTQFRFVPGLAGGGTVSIQSVNFPDRYWRVVDGTSLRIDPVEDGSAYAAQASFRRIPGLANSNGISLELSDRPGVYVRHDKGSLTVGKPSGSKSTFWLS
ncbi:MULTISPECIES: family 43 glycosylhydrolase [Micromonospora]|uniref:Alpha-arabinofuranosidase n=1 Tax=Micromonospora sicca TaxID=2202420 RepID=A0A317DM34_9ACTN|nr:MULTISPECIES: family 43 glycosylhydrolase [unclassified Micromonospora]MBM0226059.1 family 43 glycosylhydrolase [Micromonospora sp. ATA51]PWR15394.1 alpha-arabinofuranosidase [Micromonospora sp. 4G51]